jgi:4-amino-4-deoxy-L-arabinose transferase-like glycosyltransferase
MAVGTGVRAAEPGPPVQTVAALFAAFVAVWSVYFVIAESQASIRADMAEAYAWGREFQLGYNQHPPFWAWICGAWFMVFPRAGWAFAILSSLNAAIGLLGSWKLIGRFARGDERIAATALLLLTPFYTFLSHNFNANTIFLSIWPWTTYFFLRAIDEDGVVDAILFGVGMALALLSKYHALILGATCFLAAARARYFRSALVGWEELAVTGTSEQLPRTLCARASPAREYRVRRAAKDRRCASRRSCAASNFTRPRQQL